MNYRIIRRYVNVLALVVGVTSSLLATLASQLAPVAGDHFLNRIAPAAWLSRVATGVLLGGVPLEFIGVVGFTLLLVETGRPGALSCCGRAVTGLVVAGVLGGGALRTGLYGVGTDLAVVAAGWVLADSVYWFDGDWRALYAEVRAGLTGQARWLLRCAIMAMLVGCGMWLSERSSIAGLGFEAKTEFVAWYEASAGHSLLGGRAGDGHLTVFTDYQCPACAYTVGRMNRAIAQFLAIHPGAAQVSIRDFPLEPECNLAVTRVVHPLACEGAAAVRLVRREVSEAAATGFGHWLYTHQQDLTKESIRSELEVRHKLGDRYLSDYSALLVQVKGDAEVGRQLGVSSTPTFFIDGVKVTRPAEELLMAVLEHNVSRTAAARARPAR